MVDNRGQLYTIEGICAAIIVLISVYIVLEVGMVPPYPFPPGGEEARLQQIADDALIILDTPERSGQESPLFALVREKNGTGFVSDYRELLGEKTGVSRAGSPVQFAAEIWYRNADECLFLPFGTSDDVYSGGPAIRVSRFIALPENAALLWGGHSQAVLLEVLVWRG